MSNFSYSLMKKQAHKTIILLFYLATITPLTLILQTYRSNNSLCIPEFDK